MAAPAAAPATPLNQVAAHNLLMQRVWLPVFYEKLARDYRIVPQSQADCEMLVEMAGIAKNAQQVQQQNGNQSLAAALTALRKTAGVQQPASGTPAEVTEAAIRGSQDEHLARAILSLAVPAQ